MTRCAYCGSESFKPLLDGVTDRLGVVKGSRSFLKCLQCGSARLDPMPAPDELSSFYPPVYGLGRNAAGSSSLSGLLRSLEMIFLFGPVYRRNVRMLKSGGVKSGRLFDVGCGSGYQSACFKENGFDVTGADFAEGTREWMAEAHGIEAVSCDISRMKGLFKKESFDVITAFHVIEHMIDPLGFITTLKELLVPGGRIMLTMPLADSVQADMFGARWGAFREAPRHVNIPSESGVRALLERAGFGGVVVRPDHIFYIAGSGFASLSESLSMTTSYSSRSGLSLLLRRLAGVVLAGLYLPIAVYEVIGGRYSMGVASGVKGS
jgi:SAM-dependent methyltransferase